MGNINIVGIFVILKWYRIEDERRSFKLLLFWNSAEAWREHLLHIIMDNFQAMICLHG